MVLSFCRGPGSIHALKHRPSGSLLYPRRICFPRRNWPRSYSEIGRAEIEVCSRSEVIGSGTPSPNLQIK